MRSPEKINERATVKRRRMSNYEKKKMKEGLEELKKQELICAICRNLKINPTLVDCGHDFC